MEVVPTGHGTLCHSGLGALSARGLCGQGRDAPCAGRVLTRFPACSCRGLPARIEDWRGEMKSDGTDRMLRFEGKRFYYRVVEGPGGGGLCPAVFVSGAFQNMDSWKRFEREFTRHTTVVLVDLPGTGRSDILPSAYGIDFLASALEGLFDELGLKRAEILATSYGTPVAYTFARRNPSRVSHLILGGIMKRIPEHLWARTEHTISTVMKGRMHEFAMEVIGGLTYREDPGRIMKHKLVERVLYSALVSMGLDERAKYVENTLRLLHHEPLETSGYPDVRTLVFTGEYDVYTPPEDCREMAASMPNSAFTTIRNTDHLFSLERFDVMMEMFMDFLAERPGYAVEGCTEYELFRRRGALAQ